MCTCRGQCTGACLRGGRRDERGEVASGLIIVGCIVLALIVGFGVWGLRVAFAPQLGAAQKRINTNTGPYIESTYNKFYDECAAIVSNEIRQKIYTQQLETAKQQNNANLLHQAQINLDAVVANHADLVTQYNADSSKTGTEAQHKASDLPWNIDPNSQEPTKCAR